MPKNALKCNNSAYGTLQLTLRPFLLPFRDDPNRNNHKNGNNKRSLHLLHACLLLLIDDPSCEFHAFIIISISIATFRDTDTGFLYHSFICCFLLLMVILISTNSRNTLNLCAREQLQKGVHFLQLRLLFC